MLPRKGGPEDSKAEPNIETSAVSSTTKEQRTTCVNEVCPHLSRHNHEANEAIRSVVEGHIEPDITFTRTDPPVGELRT